MSTYGAQNSGFIRKPLTEILKSIETENIVKQGAGVIQTSESPLGQINGVMADTISDTWEIAEAVYQSFDPDQSEGRRLESLGKLRLIKRSALTDIEMRKQISNRGVNKYNLRGVEQDLLELEGITYLQSFLNDDGELNAVGLALGDVCIAVIGGDDDEIADSFVSLMPIGGNTYGNTVINSTAASGVSQSFNLLRVTPIRVELSIEMELKNDTFDLFQPDLQQIAQGFVDGWSESRVNGRDVDSFTIRREIECRYPNIELTAFTATVSGGAAQAENAPVAIAFDEIADIVFDDVTAVFV